MLPLEIKLPIVLVGVLFMTLGFYYYTLTKRTPKDKLIPWGLLGGGWMTHTAAYANAVALFLLSLFCILFGIIA